MGRGCLWCTVHGQECAALRLVLHHVFLSFSVCMFAFYKKELRGAWINQACVGDV